MNSYGTGGQPNEVAVFDLNGDGKSDLVSADWSDNTVNVLLGNGNGTFQTRRTYSTGGGTGLSRSCSPILTATVRVTW